MGAARARREASPRSRRLYRIETAAEKTEGTTVRNMTDSPDDLKPENAEEEISLDALKRAFASAIDGGEDSEPPADTAATPPAGAASADSAETDPGDVSQPTGVDTSEIDAVIEAAQRLETAASEAAASARPDETAAEQDALFADDEDDGGPVRGPGAILEAMLFVGSPDNRPLAGARAAELMRGVTVDEIPKLVQELNTRYDRDARPYRILEEPGGYRIALRPEADPVRGKFYGRVKEAKLSQAAIDALSIVAYRQPITGEEVNRIRSAPSGHLLSQLVRRMLLRVTRDAENSRTTYYHTTDRFLELFGLETVADLPQLEELE